MTERPILFSDAMVRAILSGAKTQTRRVIQAPAKSMQRAGMCVIKNRAPGDPWYGDHVWSMRGSMGVWGDYTDERFRSLCPYGSRGSRLWVREAWRPEELADCTDGVRFRADDGFRPIENTPAAADRWLEVHGGIAAVEAGTVARWRPSIHMPRWASRLTLEVTDVRVERVQSISEEDARAEGAFYHCETSVSYRAHFRDLWDSINSDRPRCSWADDPWVWAVGFRRLEADR